MEEIRFNVWKAVKFKNLKKNSNSNAILTCVVFLFEVIIYKKKKKILIYDINGRYKITGN